MRSLLDLSRAKVLHELDPHVELNDMFSSDPRGSARLAWFAGDVRLEIDRRLHLQFDHLAVTPAALHQLAV